MRVLLLPVVAFLSACDLFAIRCEDDDDCPGDVPFCVDDVCLNEEEAERRGRDTSGEGEGEDEACSDDSACPGGLCYDVAGDNAFTDFIGQCVPRPEDEDCLSLFASNGAQGRVEGGAAIFDVIVKDQDGPCRTLEMRFFDREGDVNITSPFIVVHQFSGSGQTPQGSLVGDGTTGTIAFNICVTEGETVGIQLFDNSERTSNVVCHHP